MQTKPANGLAGVQEKEMPKLEYKIVATVLGLATTFAVQKALGAVWSAVTGHEPPDPFDLEVSAGEAVSWVAASAVGAAVADLAVRRFAAKRYQNIGEKLPKNL